MKRDYDPKNHPDDKRSTWWMEDKSLNYKMERWADKFHD